MPDAPIPARPNLAAHLTFKPPAAVPLPPPEPPTPAPAPAASSDASAEEADATKKFAEALAAGKVEFEDLKAFVLAHEAAEVRAESSFANLAERAKRFLTI
jgi:hypothetical protein